MTARLRLLTLGLTLAAATVPATADARAQMFVPTGRATLRGLPGVEVLIEGLPPDLERGGLTTSALRAVVMQRLRAAGIRVYASQSENPSPAKPYLYIALNALTLPEGAGYAIAVQVHLRQTLRSLVTESNIVNAMTWEAHNVLVAPAAELPLLPAEVGAFVDLFVADWVAVH